ncbi:putative pentatricopeptide repeat-containing protein At3g18840 [Salvia splendens]|uniref:putative pentatricopeptide repeat-containing protein At3g18840 n=1 Tax=Salvia splendens TaxID=180675 RepID=UPI001C277A05|nr:putative pentatricopeptide repeat-containing protein At3g18840 [Salvia splendens]XP_041994355.1 putative pentatricopeptide repeat-containing protein At3g18840 [Salvia splendens]
MRSLKEGLKFHAYAVKFGLLPRIITANHIIDLYSKHYLTRDAHKLFDEICDRNVYSWNTIINAYVRSRNLPKAKDLFDSSPFKDTVTYNLVISGYARSDGYESNAIELFIQMQFDEVGARIDEFTLTTMLNLLAKLRVLRYGIQVHSFMVKSGNDRSGFALSSLVDMYSKCGSFWDACRVVDGRGGEGVVDCVVNNALIAACCREGQLEIAKEIFLKDPELNDEVSWNTMITGCAQNGRGEEAVELFRCMAREGYSWNEHTFGSLLAACSALKSLNLGKEVHARVLKDGMFFNPFICSGVVDIYSRCGEMRYADCILRATGMRNVFAVTSMIVGYAARGEMGEARSLFDSATERNFVMWTAVISGYVRLQRCEDAFALFREYAAVDATTPDGVILVSMLVACAVQAGVDPGKQIHGYILRVGITLDEKAMSALIDMYSKCGVLLYAERLFERVRVRDTIMYNVMIAGCAHHGFEHEAIRLFEDMVGWGLHPDAITFIALLSACRHSGLVEVGESYFLSMSRDYGIQPEMNHYACMVDLYGRANQLEKAVKFMEEMPIEPDSVVLSAFLTGCRASKNIELARMAEKKLVEIEGDEGSRLFQLASLYASGGEWEEKGRMMRRMRGKEVKKVAGCSWIQFGGGVHSFRSGDKSHVEAEAVYSTLGWLISELYYKGVDENYPILIDNETLVS